MPDQQANIKAIIDEGFRLQTSGKLREAEQMYKQVLAIDPENAEAMQLWGHIAEATRNYHAAAELMRRSLALEPSQAEVWVSYAKLLTDIREDDQAVKALEAAIHLRPDYAHAHFNLGVAMISTGRPEEAPGHLRKAISIVPDYSEPYRVLAILGEIKPDSEYFDKIEGLVAQGGLPAEKLLNLHYALANIYKKAGDKKAFGKHLFEANRIQSECAPPKFTRVVPEHERIIANFTPENMAKATQASPPDFTPIFIVGLPRSGTTLVERILSSHPLVEAGEELQFLRGPTIKLLKEATGKPFPEGFQDLPAHHLQIIAREYTERTQRVFPDAAFITDKNPGNFFAIGLIKILMTNAKVLAIHRDPMDTCFSILQHTFYNTMPFCCDLERMATYYREYQAQIKHWHGLLPGFVLDVYYEDVVRDQEKQSRRILEFCGLDWDDSCLEFFQNEKAVRTLSASQVRRPIYTSSIGAWKEYRKELAPLIKALGDLVVD